VVSTPGTLQLNERKEKIQWKPYMKKYEIFNSTSFFLHFSPFPSSSSTLNSSKKISELNLLYKERD